MRPGAWLLRRAGVAAVVVVGFGLGGSGALPTAAHQAGPPAAEGPSAGPPACAWLLAGTWAVAGEHTAGRLAGRTYQTAVTFRQFGDHLVGTQAEDRVTYYGRCSADDLELEIWLGWEYIGQQTAHVAPDGLTMTASWVVWSPDRMEGQSTWTGQARRQR